MIRNVAGVAYTAGAETVSAADESALAHFLDVQILFITKTFVAILNGCLAILLYPEVQKKAQAELDEVIGDRLPTLEDRTKLPYKCPV